MKVMMRRSLRGLTVALLAASVHAAPVTVTPGSIASYLYFPAASGSGSGTARTVDAMQTARTLCYPATSSTVAGNVTIPAGFTEGTVQAIIVGGGGSGNGSVGTAGTASSITYAAIGTVSAAGGNRSSLFGIVPSLVGGSRGGEAPSGTASGGGGGGYGGAGGWGAGAGYAGSSRGGGVQGWGYGGESPNGSLAPAGAAVTFPAFIPCYPAASAADGYTGATVQGRGGSGFGAGGGGYAGSGGGSSGAINVVTFTYTGGTISYVAGAGGSGGSNGGEGAPGVVAFRFVPK